jgi:hypothetical protein
MEATISPGSKVDSENLVLVMELVKKVEERLMERSSWIMENTCNISGRPEGT